MYHSICAYYTRSTAHPAIRRRTESYDRAHKSRNRYFEFNSTGVDAHAHTQLSRFLCCVLFRIHCAAHSAHSSRTYDILRYCGCISVADSHMKSTHYTTHNVLWALGKHTNIHIHNTQYTRSLEGRRHSVD